MTAKVSGGQKWPANWSPITSSCFVGISFLSNVWSNSVLLFINFSKIVATGITIAKFTKIHMMVPKGSSLKNVRISLARIDKWLS